MKLFSIPICGLLALLTTILGPGHVQAQSADERIVKAEALPLDRADVWTLNFGYTPPRIAKLQTPDQGEMIVWYMKYYVYNTFDTPQTFIPSFELVTKDIAGKRGTFVDEPQPTVVDAIRKIEDPTGELNLQTSVSISKEKIPVTKPESFPRSVYGIAVWIDVPKDTPNVNNFSIYVSGLSNGLTTKETLDGKILVSKKTLQLDFRRPTDSVRNKSMDIKIFDNRGLGAEKWIYRDSRTLDLKAKK